MAFQIAVLPGDGIGPEVVQATVRAVEATAVDIRWRRAELNEAIILESGKTLPAYLLDSLNETRIGLKGPVTTPVAGGFQEGAERAARHQLASAAIGVRALRLNASK